MLRCPACNARLSASTLCPRCGTDLSRVLGCERSAASWLSVSLQTLHADRADVAVAAIERSLSFKQTQAAKLVKGFLVEHQYRALYESLGQQHWQEAGHILARLRRLRGDNEALRRFSELIAWLSAGMNSD